MRPFVSEYVNRMLQDPDNKFTLYLILFNGDRWLLISNQPNFLLIGLTTENNYRRNVIENHTPKYIARFYFHCLPHIHLYSFFRHLKDFACNFSRQFLSSSEALLWFLCFRSNTFMRNTKYGKRRLPQIISLVNLLIFH